MKTYLYADMDQMVFEGRPKEYGAYVMRKRYNHLLMRATLITFLLFVSVTVFPKVADWVMPDATVEPIADPTCKLIPVESLPLPPLLEDEIQEVAPPPQPKPPKVKVTAFLQPKPVPDDLAEDEATIAKVEELDNTVIGLVDQDGEAPGDYNYNFDEFGDGDIPTDIVVKEEKPDPKPDDFVLLEKEPTPVNMDELKNLIGYPPMAKEADIQGKVILRILVDKFGNYKKHLVLKSPHSILTEAVTKHISKLQVTPGIQAGKPINVWLTVPFNFFLQ